MNIKIHKMIMISFLIFTTVTFLLITPTYANDNKAVLIIKVSGFQSNNGKAMIALYNSKEEYDSGNKGFREAQLVINKEQVTWIVKDLQNGEYAIKLYVDENNNNIMDTNFFGIPKEAIGFSNNAEVGMSAPSFEEVMFIIKDEVVKQTIQLNYM